MHHVNRYKFVIVIKDTVQGSQTVIFLYVELLLKHCFEFDPLILVFCHTATLFCGMEKQIHL